MYLIASRPFYKMAAKLLVLAAAGVGANQVASRMSTAEAAKKEADDCARPACATMKSMLQEAMKPQGANAQQRPAVHPETAQPNCPLGREELGRATWSLVRVVLSARLAQKIYPAKRCCLMPSC